MGSSIFDKARDRGPKYKDRKAQIKKELTLLAFVPGFVLMLMFLESIIINTFKPYTVQFNAFMQGLFHALGPSFLSSIAAMMTIVLSWLLLVLTANLVPMSLKNSLLVDSFTRYLTRHQPPTLKLHAYLDSYPVLIVRILSIYGLVFLGVFTWACGTFSVIGNDGDSRWFICALRDAGYNSKLFYDFNSIRMFLATWAAFFTAVPLSLMLSGFQLFGNTKVRLTPSYIHFPIGLGCDLKFRLKRPWVDVDHVSLQGSSGLEFNFRSGGRATIPPNALSPIDTSYLLQAIEELCVDCDVDPKLTEYAALEANLTMQIPSSFTHLWNEGLTHQFKATVFSPCEPGAMLQDGRIRVVRQLASTPWSATFLARVDGHQLVVLKELLLPQSDSANAKARELFLRECAIVLSLDHPGLARLQDRFAEAALCANMK